MFEYREDVERRIVQFAGLLKKMHDRAHEEVCGSCFMIFSENSSDDERGWAHLSAAAKPELELVSTVFGDDAQGSLALDDSLPFVELPDEGWREDDSQKRFIQYSFEEKWFCLDMPLQTLYRPEAEQILRSRRGFFFLRDRPEFTLYEEDVEGYDPFRKIYLYGDETAAAEDMAYIWFDVWKFPPDWRFCVKAAAFGDHITNWERNTPLE